MSTLRETLQARGIAEAADVAGWTEATWYGEPGWAFPLRSATGKVYTMPDGRTARRWKAGTTPANRKYMWGYEDQRKGDLKQPEHCRYYWIGEKDMREVITAAGGVLHITAGEPDALTLYAMGYENVTSFFGEGSVPDSLVDDMELLGVSEVCYYADNDNAGYDAAEKVRAVLAQTLIKCTVYTAPQEHNDLNDLYVATGRDADATMQAIRTVTLGELDAPPQAAEPNFNAQGYISAITTALGATWKRHRSGWSQPMACIFANHEHDDRNPAAGWSESKQSYRCFKCGHTWDIDEVAEQIGVAKSDYWTEPAPAMKTAKAQPSQAAPPSLDNYFKSSDQGLSKVLARINGDVLSDALPIINPISELHHLGGFCRLLTPGKIVGILGLSGGGKTSFVESMIVDPLRQIGISGVFWGPEWTYDEYAERSIQRYSQAVTMDDLSLHYMHMSEERARKAGQRATRFGKPLTNTQTEDVVRTVGKIAEWPGKTHYETKMGVTASQLIDLMQRKVDTQRAQGSNVRLAVFDYVQLMEVAGARSERENIQSAINMIKTFCVDNELIGIVNSQPTKAGSAESKAKGDTLDDEGYIRDLHADAAQFMREWVFNLFLTLTPAIRDGQQLNWGRVNVVKNSRGKEGHVDLQTDFARLRWLDRKRGRGKTIEYAAAGD